MWPARSHFEELPEPYGHPTGTTPVPATKLPDRPGSSSFKLDDLGVLAPETKGYTGPAVIPSQQAAANESDRRRTTHQREARREKRQREDPEWAAQHIERRGPEEKEREERSDRQLRQKSQDDRRRATHPACVTKPVEEKE